MREKETRITPMKRPQKPQKYEQNRVYYKCLYTQNNTHPGEVPQIK